MMEQIAARALKSRPEIRAVVEVVQGADALGIKPVPAYLRDLLELEAKAAGLEPELIAAVSLVFTDYYHDRLPALAQDDDGAAWNALQCEVRETAAALVRCQSEATGGLPDALVAYCGGPIRARQVALAFIVLMIERVTGNRSTLAGLFET